VHGSFDLQRVNTLELAMLDALGYFIRVPAGEYAKYYFHLRSMMAKLGIRENEPNMLKPLNLAGARKLQLATEKYQEEKEDNTRFGRRRSFTIHVGENAAMLQRMNSEDGRTPYNYQKKLPVVLEQLVHAVHVDADGQQHITPSKRRGTPTASGRTSPRPSTSPGSATGSGSGASTKGGYSSTRSSFSGALTPKSPKSSLTVSPEGKIVEEG
jgi:hypothetical protein